MAPDGGLEVQATDIRRRPLEPRPWETGVSPPDLYCTGTPESGVDTDFLDDLLMASCPLGN